MVPTGTMSTGQTSNTGVEIWLLQYGPCWCRSPAPETGSFDYVRLRKSVADPGVLDESLLVVSDRVIDGTARMYRQVHQEVPEPRLVVATAPCPYANSFWDELPNGWGPVEDLLPIDLHIDDCISGNPEALLTGVLGHLLTRDDRQTSDEPAEWFIQKAATDA